MTHKGEETESLADASAAAGPAVLVVLGDGVERSFPLPPSGHVDIGRAPECAVQLDHRSISRRHARLHIGPPLRLEDLGGRNPARVRGAPLAPGASVELAPGELVELGRLIALVRGAAPRSQQPQPQPPPLPWRPPETEKGPVVVLDPAMRRIYELVQRVAPGDVPVLILGETGVGKEVVAEALHRYSPRARGPFVRLNCAALPATLVEAELFGYEKGAFTGADRDRPGLIAAAHGGTLFLDEVGDLPLPLQASLLRVLEDRAVLPVGGQRARPIDVRFVAATNRALRDEVEAGRFRRDLFYRLHGVSFTVPPLRERPAEISALAETFAAQAGAALSPEAVAALRRHPWPGNVRELRHAIAGAALLAAGGPILPAHLPIDPTAAPPPQQPPQQQPPPTREPLRDELSQVERERIITALREAAGNQTRAAALLGMPRRTLLRRLAQYDIPRGRVIPDDET